MASLVRDSLPRRVAAYADWREKERRSLQAYLLAIEKKLANEQFVAHAPDEVVALEQQKLAEAAERLRSLIA